MLRLKLNHVSKRGPWYFIIKTGDFNKILLVTCVPIWNRWWVMVQWVIHSSVCKYRISMNTGFLISYIRGITSPHWKFSWIMCLWDNRQVYNTMRCHYNAVIFLRNFWKKKHPVGQDMWCVLPVYILPHSLQWCVQHNVILDRGIMAPDCKCHINRIRCNHIFYFSGQMILLYRLWFLNFTLFHHRI